MALEFQLDRLCNQNRSKSHTTQANRRSMLKMFAQQLGANGYNTKTMKPSDLKGRHVNKLIEQWRKDGVSIGTIKNRMAAVRWWAETVGNPAAVKENSVYGLENRVYVTNENKSLSLKDLDLSRVDPLIAQSLRLQDAFGLRREESMKFQPEYALDGQKIENAKYVRLKDSWTKGGRARSIPISTEKQRKELRSAYTLALSAGGSLIPKESSYKSHKSRFEAVTHSLGVGQTHGLRHGYAQERYRVLMGFDCPAVGGLRQLTAEEVVKDREIRLMISEELGHSRLNVTSIYLGSWSKK